MRRMVSTLLLCALLVSTASSASCNQQGDLARLLDVLEGSHEYDEYSYFASGFDKIWANYVGAVVSSLDASELLLLRRNWVGDYEQVGRYPRAVYQPEDGNVPCWELHWIEDDGFSLSLLRDGVPAESYVFAWDGFDRVHRQPQLVLREAQVNGLNFRFRDERGRYTVTDATDSASWQVDAIPLERFCMDLMPRSLEAVKRSNVLHAVLADELNDEVQERVNFGRSETLPVYTAPSEDAYRDDEAAVSLEAPFTVRNALDGDIWWMIDYAISGTSGRIGYVKRPKDGHVKRGTFSTTPIAVTLGQNAALTDDPYGSCRELTRLPAGAQVISLGWLDAFYACVETQIEGKAARGYLPLHALELPTETPQTDAAAKPAEDSNSAAYAFGGARETPEHAALRQELRDKLAKEQEAVEAKAAGAAPLVPHLLIPEDKVAEAGAALAVLGYSQTEIQQALRGLDLSALSREEIIKAALKNMVK